MISANRSSLRKQLEEKVVAPTDRARLHPDTGVASISSGYYKYTPGSTNTVTSNLSFWEKVTEIFVGIEHLLFPVDGLKADEILVDITARTPDGLGVIPNVRLNLNNFDHKQNDLLNRLIKGQSIQVKIIYDGGRVTECTPVSWVFDYPNAERIKAEADQTAYANNPTGEGWGPTDASSAAGAPSSPSVFSGTLMGNPKGTKAAFLTDLPLWQSYISVINAAANQWGMDANLIAAMIMAESSGLLNQTSPTGAKGLMQIEPGTFDEVYPTVSAAVTGLRHDQQDPATSIMCGSYYMSTILTKFSGDLTLSVAGYNAGPYTPSLAMGRVPNVKETKDYVQRILAIPGGFYCQFSTRSVVLAQAKAAQRQEEAHLDQTSATAKTAYAIVGGGAA